MYELMCFKQTHRLHQRHSFLFYLDMQVMTNSFSPTILISSLNPMRYWFIPNLWEQNLLKAICTFS